MSYSITPLLTGVRNPDQGIMTYQQGYGKRIWLPIWAFLVQGQGVTLLVDSGLDENELIVPAGFTEETGLVPASLVDASWVVLATSVILASCRRKNTTS